MDSNEKLLTLQEAMERLDMSIGEVYSHITAGALVGKREDGAMAFTEEDLTAFADAKAEEKASFEKSLAGLLDDLGARLEKRGETDLPDLDDKDDAQKQEELLRRLLVDGILSGATDIHLDPLHTDARLIYRYDNGVMESLPVDRALADVLTAALSARLPAAEGEDAPPITEVIITHSHADHDHQIQLQVAPSLLGDHVHLHFYDDEKMRSIETLGYTPRQMEVMQDLIGGRAGLLLFTGAAGEAADRHRNALAVHLADAGRLVVSLERHPHYRSEQLVQLDAGPADEAAFRVLMAKVLDMKPDVLILDEVPDVATARGMLEAVSSGALVMADMRVPGVVSALLQLKEWEINPNVVSRLLLGAVERVSLHQLCAQCRKAEPLPPEKAELFGDDAPAETYAPVGCDACGNGTIARRIVFGLWAVDDDMAEAMQTLEAPADGLLEWNTRNPLSLAQAAKEAVICGDVELPQARRLLLNQRRALERLSKNEEEQTA